MNLELLLKIVEIVLTDRDKCQATDVEALADELQGLFRGASRQELLTLIELSIAEITHPAATCATHSQARQRTNCVTSA